MASGQQFDFRKDISQVKRDIRPISPFGVLSDTLSRDIISRYEAQTGFYFPYTELSYLQEEEAEDIPAAAVQKPAEGQRIDLHIDLDLMLNGSRLEQRAQAVEQQIRSRLRYDYRLKPRAYTPKKLQAVHTGFGTYKTPAERQRAMRFPDVLSKAQDSGITFGGFQIDGLPVAKTVDRYQARERFLEALPEKEREKVEALEQETAERVLKGIRPSAVNEEKSSLQAEAAVRNNEAVSADKEAVNAAPETEITLSSGTAPEEKGGFFAGIMKALGFGYREETLTHRETENSDRASFGETAARSSGDRQEIRLELPDIRTASPSVQGDKQEGSIIDRLIGRLTGKTGASADAVQEEITAESRPARTGTGADIAGVIPEQLIHRDAETAASEEAYPVSHRSAGQPEAVLEQLVRAAEKVSGGRMAGSPSGQTTATGNVKAAAESAGAQTTAAGNAKAAAESAGAQTTAAGNVKTGASADAVQEEITAESRPARTGTAADIIGVVPEQLIHRDAETAVSEEAYPESHRSVGQPEAVLEQLVRAAEKVSGGRMAGSPSGQTTAERAKAAAESAGAQTTAAGNVKAAAESAAVQTAAERAKAAAESAAVQTAADSTEASADEMVLTLGQTADGAVLNGTAADIIGVVPEQLIHREAETAASSEALPVSGRSSQQQAFLEEIAKAAEAGSRRTASLMTAEADRTEGTKTEGTKTEGTITEDAGSVSQHASVQAVTAADSGWGAALSGTEVQRMVRDISEETKDAQYAPVLIKTPQTDIREMNGVEAEAAGVIPEMLVHRENGETASVEMLPAYGRHTETDKAVLEEIARAAAAASRDGTLLRTAQDTVETQGIQTELPGTVNAAAAGAYAAAEHTPVLMPDNSGDRGTERYDTAVPPENLVYKKPEASEAPENGDSVFRNSENIGMLSRILERSLGDSISRVPAYRGRLRGGMRSGQGLRTAAVYAAPVYRMPGNGTQPGNSALAGSGSLPGVQTLVSHSMRHVDAAYTAVQGYAGMPDNADMIYLAENSVNMDGGTPGEGHYPPGRNEYSAYRPFHMHYTDSVAQKIDEALSRVGEMQSFGQRPDFELEQSFRAAQGMMDSGTDEPFNLNMEYQRMLQESGPVQEWNNPYMSGMGEAITFRNEQKTASAAQPPAPQRTVHTTISDAEIRRTADRVYSLVQDRIKHERRVNGYR